MPRGRKRKFHPSIPAHIDQNKLPDNCYWDAGRKHWYTTYKDERCKQRRKRIAGPDARLFELHQIIEEWNGIERDSFRWLVSKYFNSERYNAVSRKSQKDYQSSAKALSEYPTRLNKPIDLIPINLWDSYLVQRLIDESAKNRGPSAAKHLYSFIRLVFKWSKNRGYCRENPAQGIELPKERKQQRLPTQRAYDALLAYAKKNGTYGQNTKGSCAYYIWILMELEYLCRMRGIECRNLTEDNILEEGLRINRTKGSRDNIVLWNPRLEIAIRAALQARAKIWGRKKHVVPVKAQDRLVLVNASGDPIEEAAYHSVWQRFIKNAIENGIIEQSERFSLHDLKRKGVTDTKGTRQEKQEASGHRSEQMLDVYDKSVPMVKPASD